MDFTLEGVEDALLIFLRTAYSALEGLGDALWFSLLLLIAFNIVFGYYQKKRKAKNERDNRNSD